MTKHAVYRWPEIKEMLEDIQPENKCYSRVQALIKCGDEILVDHARLVDIIKNWHRTHTTLLTELKAWIKEAPGPLFLVPGQSPFISETQMEVWLEKYPIRVEDKL